MTPPAKRRTRRLRPDGRIGFDLRIPRSLHDRVKAEAHRRDVGPNRIYTEAVEAWLDRRELRRPAIATGPVVPGMEELG